jgi:hypothetical protein
MGQLREQVSKFKDAHLEFFCGWSAGLMETCILFPSSKLVFRQQLYGLAAKAAATQVVNITQL